MTDNEPNAAATAAGPQSPAPNGAPAAAPDLRDSELAQLRDELDQMKDRAMRALAELDNYRKRADRTIAEERRYASLPLVRDLLPVLDNIKRAIEAAQKTADAAPLLEGFQLVARMLESVLAKHHCVSIPALHQPFNPHVHEAVLQQPSSEHPPNTVLQELQTGYLLHDRVVRPSQVIVSSAPQAPSPADGT